MTGWERLNRFDVAHSPCAGNVDYSEPADGDLVDADEGMAWMAVRCENCGASARELVSLKEMFADFIRLLNEAGLDPNAVVEAVRSGDEKALEEINEQLKASPAMLREALASIRKAQARESQN